MLDEPMAGVNPALVQSLLGHVTALRDEGMSVIFVEHDMDVVMGISDWVVVLAEGRVIAEGRPTDIMSDRPSSTPTSAFHDDPSTRSRGVSDVTVRHEPILHRPRASTPGTCPASTSSTAAT